MRRWCWADPFITIGVGLLCIPLIYWLRPADEPPPDAPVPARQATMPQTPPAPEAPAADPPSATPLLAAVESSAGLLDGLAAAIRSGDDAAIRAAMDRLRRFLAPPVPPEKNAGLIYERALGRARGLKRLDMFKGLADPAKFPLAREELVRQAGEWGEIADLLRQAAALPDCRFTPEVEGGLHTRGKTLLEMQLTAQILQLAARIETGEGRPAAALEAVSMAQAMGRAVRSEPGISGLMFAAAVETLSFESLQGALGPDAPAGLLQDWNPAEIREAHQRALLGSAYEEVDSFLRLKADPGGAENMAAYVRMISEFERLASRPYSEVRHEVAALARREKEFSPAYARLSRDIALALSGAAHEVARSEARFAMLRVAIEAERYRASRGVYPETLDALGTILPRDPISGEPFAFRREGDGIVIESAEPPGGKRVVWRRQR